MKHFTLFLFVLLCCTSCLRVTRESPDLLAPPDLSNINALPICPELGEYTGILDGRDVRTSSDKSSYDYYMRTLNKQFDKVVRQSDAFDCGPDSKKIIIDIKSNSTSNLNRIKPLIFLGIFLPVPIPLHSESTTQLDILTENRQLIKSYNGTGKSRVRMISCYPLLFGLKKVLKDESDYLLNTVLLPYLLRDKEKYLNYIKSKEIELKTIE